MSILVTGGTGFIGRHLIPLLLDRGERVRVVVREASLPRLESLRRGWGPAGAKVEPVVGDLSAPGLGVSEADREALRGRIEHAFHLAALYDMNASAEQLTAANVEGTRNALALFREKRR